MAHAHAVALAVFIRFMVSASNKCEGSYHLGVLQSVVM